jgi:hypothetical protein
MRKSLVKMIAVTGLGLVLASPAYADAQLVDTMLGAGAGGYLGSMIGHGSGRLAATGAGVFLGGAIGNNLGRPSYGAYYARPSYNYYPNYSYDMFPSQAYYVPYQPNYVAPPAPPPAPPVTYIDEDSGNYCREYSQQIRIGNQVRESYGTACLQPDGSWHIVQ